MTITRRLVRTPNRPVALLRQIGVGEAFEFVRRPGLQWMRLADSASGAVRIRETQVRLTATARAEARVHPVTLEG